MKEQKQKTVVLYLLNHVGNEIEDIKLYLLLWLSDRIHLNKYGRTITYDDYDISKLYIEPINIEKMIFIDYYSFSVIHNFVSSNIKYDNQYLSVSDEEVLDYVINKYYIKTTDELLNMYYSSPEYNRFDFNENYISDKMIVTDLFLPFVEEVDYEYDKELSGMSRESYEFQKNINEFFNK